MFPLPEKFFEGEKHYPRRFLEQPRFKKLPHVIEMNATKVYRTGTLPRPYIFAKRAQPHYSANGLTGASNQSCEVRQSTAGSSTYTSISLPSGSARLRLRLAVWSDWP